MRIDSAIQAVYEQLPSRQTIAKSATTMAMTAIALEALSSIPMVDGGPITYSACILACAGLFPPLVPICVAGCLPALAAPTP